MTPMSFDEMLPVIFMALIATVIFLVSDLAVLWLEPRARIR